jgi:hypothetical protein
VKALIVAQILFAPWAGGPIAWGDEKKPVEVVCPVDGTKFTAFEVLTTNQWGGLDLDFCPHAYKTTPLEWKVWVCPSCRFAGLRKDFDLKLSEDEKKALQSGLVPALEIKKGARQGEIPGHVKYDLLAQVAALRKQAPEEIGRAYLHASWCARQQGAVSFEDFDEWEALRSSYGLNRTPMELGTEKGSKRPKNRTDYEIEVAGRLEKDIAAKKPFGVNKILSPYLAAYLYRKHGENAQAERWLKSLPPNENSVVDEAASKMRASIELERAYQKKAIEAYLAAIDRGRLESRAQAEAAYLVGELYRRRGELDSASSWYRTAAESATTEELRKLAQDQKAKIEK